MSEMFLEVFNRSMAAGWLALAVLLLRLVTKKAPKWTHCLLWALVGLRLVWPFSLQSALSLLPSREMLPPETLYDRTPEIQTGIELINRQINASFTPAMTASEVASVNPLQIWTWLAGWLWVVGAALMLAYAVVSWLRLRKRVAVSIRENDVYCCDAIDSPFILGIYRPKIYVPSDLEGQALTYVLAHEQAHLRRRDHWWKPLGYLLLTVFWFHPLLWVAYIQLCRDIELACDERVIRDLDLAEKKDYSQALLACSVHRRQIAACPVAFGEVGVKARIRSVLHYKKPAFWIVAICLVLCIVAAVCFLTDPIGFQLEFELEDIAQASTLDLRLNSGPIQHDLTAAQQEELWFRLRDLKRTRKADVYGGFTPFYSLSLQLTDGRWLRVQGYALDASMVDIVWEETAYQVQDEDFCAYLNRICAGDDRAAAQELAYYSSACIFMNPLSSVMASEDSGDYYYASDSEFVIGSRRTMTERCIGPVVWNWQDFPWTDAEWEEKFFANPVDVSDYADRKYQLLDLEHYLLQMDGELWLVEDHGDSRVGIWSIYKLKQADSLSEARWMYMDGAGEPLVIQFDLEYDEVQLTCTGGVLHGTYENINDDVLHYYGDQILYWTATASEDVADVAWEAVIEFTVFLDGERLFAGSVEASVDRYGVPWFHGRSLEPGIYQPRIEFGEDNASVRICEPLPSVKHPVRRTIGDLRSGDIQGIALHNGAGGIDLEDLRQLLQQAVEKPVNGQDQLWWGWEIQLILTDERVLTLAVGPLENQVEIRQDDQLLYVSNEELYWLVRTCNDTEPAGVDPVGYELCRELVDSHLNYIPDLPAGVEKEQITKELTGVVLQDSSEKLNAQAWRMDVAWNVDPPELSIWLIAGGAQIDSQMRCRGMNASETYIIVVDGEPIGFVGWWFLMDRTLDDQFSSQDDLIKAVENDG